MKLIADMHTHTCASTHAFSTISENAASAAKAGIKYLGMTDHGLAMPDCPHMWHFISMVNIPRQLDGVYIIRGMEANLTDYEGKLDIDEEILYDRLEWIVASYHHGLCDCGTVAQHTNSYVKVLENPKVFAIGHPDSNGFEFDEVEVAKACRHFNKAIELNNSRLNSQHSINRYKQILTACAENDCFVIVDTDSHFCSKIGQFDNALKLLEEIHFPERLIRNAENNGFDEYIRDFCKIDLSK